MFKFLHAADIHLDSPLRGLERYDGAPVEQIRGATRRALESLVRLAVDEKVDFVLLAGDLYDGDWRDFHTGLFLTRQMARLKEAGIPVFTLAGNHDAANKMTRSLPLPDNVKVLSTKKPETCVLDNLGVAIHGQGFATQAVWEDLTQQYPAATKGCFNIGLLHTCASCTDGHERYAPCTVDGLRLKEYDYWALGHIHQGQVLHRSPPIVFPGNVQGRHIREDGAKGCRLVTAADGQAVELEFRSLDVVRWHRCAVAARAKDDAEAILDRTMEELKSLRQNSEPSLWAVRVEIYGGCKAHAALQAQTARWASALRARALDLDAERLWLEKVKFQTSPEQEAVVAQQVLDGPLEELAAILNELRGDPQQLEELAASLAELKRKLPAELTQGHDGLDPTDPNWLRHVLDQVEPVLRQRLLCPEGAP